MRRLAITALAAALAVLCIPATASAACLAMTEKQLEEQADVIFKGVVLEGPTSNGIQRVRVARYLKGNGPRVASVATGVTPSSVTSESIHVTRGDPVRILGRLNPKSGVIETSECSGSGRIGFPDFSTALPAVGNEAGSNTRALIAAALLALATLALLTRRRFRRSPT